MRGDRDRLSIIELRAEKCMIARGAEIDWGQPGRSPYDRTHAEL